MAAARDMTIKSPSSSASTKTPAPAASLRELVHQLDCEAVALRLGLERPTEKGRFRNPVAKSKGASLLCLAARDGYASSFEDHVTDAHGGPIDLYMHVKDERDEVLAVVALADLFGMLGPTGEEAEHEPSSKLDWIADRALTAAADPAKRHLLLGWLADRGVSEGVAYKALEAGALGLNDYTNPRFAAGELHHGGEAMAAIVRSAADGKLVGVDLAYLDPALNGGLAQASHGERDGTLWCLDWKRFEQAKRVIVVETALDLLSVETCALPATVVVALRSTWAAPHVDWRPFRGKQVALAICPGKLTEMGPGKGTQPGLRAAWQAHEYLTGLDTPALLVDMDEWVDDEDEPLASVNAYLKLNGPEKLGNALRRMEQWLIPGMPGENTEGRSRVYLPFHDSQVYWRFRVKDDFTSFISKWGKKKDEDGDETEEKGDFQFDNVCGFRVAAISRVTIASPTSTMTGDKDTSPTTIFALSVQVPRYSHRLLRRVVNDEQLHNVEVWKKLGPVYSPQNFSRLVNIMERAADIGARDAVNFVGLAWRNGAPVVNEGPDCYFSDPAQQCPYSGLVFPSGPRASARQVIDAYQKTFAGNGVTQMLVWSLGAHLKAFLGFWPHFVMQADKGVGKDTILRRLERSIGMTVFSRQSMQTEFRILTSISYTSHPVGWGELSANKQDLINKAVANLQECYQYNHTKRGSEMKDFLLCAPVLLAGEDVPVDTLHGKIVRNQLVLAKRGALMAEELPVFPVRQWLEYLATMPKAQMQALHTSCVNELATSCSASADDAGAKRMLNNYGAVRMAWTLLCDFAGIEVAQGGFMGDLTAQMNSHIIESNGDRQPWVWIVDTLLSEIARGTFRYPFAFSQTADEEEFLAVRTSHVMDHIAREPTLRGLWDELPIKSDRVFKRALVQANVIAEASVERTIRGTRVAHMVGLSLKGLEQYGLYATRPAAMAASSEGETYA